MPQVLRWKADGVNFTQRNLLGSIRKVTGGEDNSLQSSCLENPVDRGAWRATVHGVPKNWTRLSTHSIRKVSQNIYGSPELTSKQNWLFKLHILPYCHLNISLVRCGRKTGFRVKGWIWVLLLRKEIPHSGHYYDKTQSPHQNDVSWIKVDSACDVANIIKSELIFYS